MTVSIDELENLLSMHRQSLRQLTMDGVHLVSGKSKAVGWDKMTKKFGEYSTLNVVSLVDLMEDLEGLDSPSCLGDKDHKRLAGNLMGQCSYKVNLEEVDGAHIAIARRT